MMEQKEIFWETIDIFEKEGILPHVILVGSWVEFIYEFSCLPNFEASLRTRDIDFLLKNIRQPREKVDVIKILEEHDFIYDVDPVTGASKFYKEGLIEVEFLVRELGAGQVEPYYVESLGVKAEGLRNMNLLAENAITVEVNGYQITIPKPAAYVLEKLYINDYRSIKKEKDIRAVERILDMIKQSKGETETLLRLFESLSSKQKRKINEVCKEYGIILF
jgi:hypothetical protein